MNDFSKLNFFEQIHNFVRTKGADLQQNMPKVMQGHVSAIKPNDFIEFTIDANGPWTLPKIIIAQAFSKYHREPTAVGDKGYAVPNDYFIGGETGQDGSTATMYPRGNLSSLVFHPVSNKSWPTRDPDMFLVTAGKKGHTTQSADGKTSAIIDENNNLKHTSSAAITSKSATTNTVASTGQDINIVPSQSGKVTVGASSNPNADPPVPTANTIMNVLGSIMASGMIGAAGGMAGAGSAGGPPIGNAPAGAVGQVVSSVVTTPVNLTAGGQINITSIPLTPGDWDIQANIFETLANGSSACAAGINTVSGVLPGTPALNTARVQMNVTFGAGGVWYSSIGPCRALITSNTTYYLIGYSSVAATATGVIWARRMT